MFKISKNLLITIYCKKLKLKFIKLIYLLDIFIG